MANPPVATDDDTDVDAANCNRWIAGPVGKINVKVIYARVQYDGADFVVASSSDSAEIETADLTFNTGSDALEVVVSGFINPPVVIATPTLANSNYFVKARAVSNVLVEVGFYSALTTRVGTEDTSMDCQLIIIGF